MPTLNDFLTSFGIRDVIVLLIIIVIIVGFREAKYILRSKNNDTEKKTSSQVQ